MMKGVKESWTQAILLALINENDTSFNDVLKECESILDIKKDLLTKAKTVGKKTKDLDTDQKLDIMIIEFSHDNLCIYEKEDILYFEYKILASSDYATDTNKPLLIYEYGKIFTEKLVQAVYGMKEKPEILQVLVKEYKTLLVAVKIS